MINQNEKEQRTLISETDWLASEPVFYNPRTGSASVSIHDVTDNEKEPAVHTEGLYNFLNFGYSVYGQTPLEDVCFLRHSSKLWRKGDGSLEVEYLDDPFDSCDDWRLSETDIIELIRERVRSWEASLPSDQEIVLPLSGGFDSRLLLWCLECPERVRAYTYGISEDQSRSAEVVRAEILAKKFGLRWERVQLGHFHNYLDDWDELFGPSTHSHGMYHFEFYNRIREGFSEPAAFLSGIFGDVWAGSVSPQNLEAPQDLIKLGYTHGLNADPGNLLMPMSHSIRDSFWECNRKKLGSDYRFQVLTTVRLKIMLISYLMRVPRKFGFEAWTPYLDPDVAMAMLNLPQDRRRDRLWQRDFFSKVGLDLEERCLRFDPRNTLILQGLSKVPLRPLSVETLDGYFRPEFISWINRHARIEGHGGLAHKLARIPKVGGALRRLGLAPKTLPAYHAYLCVYPLEQILNRGLSMKCSV